MIKTYERKATIWVNGGEYDIKYSHCDADVIRSLYIITNGDLVDMTPFLSCGEFCGLVFDSISDSRKTESAIDNLELG